MLLGMDSDSTHSASTVAITVNEAATMRPKNPSFRHFANTALNPSAIHRPNASATIAAKAKLPNAITFPLTFRYGSRWIRFRWLKALWTPKRH